MWPFKPKRRGVFTGYLIYSWFFDIYKEHGKFEVDILDETITLYKVKYTGNFISAINWVKKENVELICPK